MSETTEAVTVFYRGYAGRRIINQYEWNEGNGYTTTVDDPAVITAIADDLQFVIERPAAVVEEIQAALVADEVANA